MKSPRILVVDDEPRAVELLVRTLRKEAKLDTAATANEAWEKYQVSDFDLVISDQRMPGGMSGIDLLSRIAEVDAHVGRILLTGYSDLEATVEAINRGRVHGYLHKPCSPEDLRLVTRGVLERIALERENERLLKVVIAQNDQMAETLQSLRAAQEKVVASERLATIGKMIAMIVHDLRSPITLIRAGGRDLVAGADEARLSELAERGREVVAETERMQRMCDDLLEVARASESSPRREEDELDGLIAAALAHIVQPASHQGVSVDFDLASHVELRLDSDAISRALRNLTNNALEAMPDGGILRVETRHEGQEAVVRVSDTGCGIPDEIIGSVFEPFVTSNKPGGSGLGLAIVRKLIQDHDGSISVDKEGGSADGERSGTTFVIRFPLPLRAE